MFMILSSRVTLEHPSIQATHPATFIPFIAVMSAVMGGKSIGLSLPAGAMAPDEEAPPDDEMDDADLENPK